MLDKLWFVQKRHQRVPEVSRTQLASRLTFGTEAEGRYELDDRGLRLYDPDGDLVADLKSINGTAAFGDQTGDYVFIDPTRTGAILFIDTTLDNAGSISAGGELLGLEAPHDTGNVAATLSLSQGSGATVVMQPMVTLVEQTTPGTPNLNTLRFYAKDKSGTSALYFKNDAGTEYELGPVGTHTHGAGDLTGTAAHETNHRSGGSDALSLQNLPSNAATASVLTSETTTSTSFTDLATTGPSVTLTPGASGLVLVSLFGAMRLSSGAASVFMGFAGSSGNTVAAADDQSIRTDAGNVWYQFGASFLLTGLAAASTLFRAKYRVSGGTGEFAYRRITVVPL